MFSNGVVTNSEWKCYTYLYGPVNWRQCFAAARNASQALFPACRDEAPPLDGCYARLTDIPQGWTQPDFDESYWEYALCRYTLKLSDSGTVAMHEGLLQLTVMTVVGAVLGTMCV